MLESTGVKSMKGKTIGEIILTDKVNAAGCYPIRLCVDGVDTIVTVDDFVPFKKNKVDEDKLAFSKTTVDENEIWMILLEKAIAKVYGSYEAMENKSVEKGFNILAGGPSVFYKLKDFVKDITRAGELKEERIDKLWEIIDKVTSGQSCLNEKEKRNILKFYLTTKSEVQKQTKRGNIGLRNLCRALHFMK